MSIYFYIFVFWSVVDAVMPIIDVFIKQNDRG